MDVFSPQPQPDDTDRPRLEGIVAWLRGRLPPGSPSATLAAGVALLMARHLRFDSADPEWPDRDRLVISPSLQPLAAIIAELAGKHFAAAPPDPPGQSLGVALGLAMAERALAARFGRSLVDHRTWVLAAAADLATGLAQEVAAATGALRLGRLTVLACMGADEPCPPSFGAAWTVRRVAMDDPAALLASVSAALRSQKPTLIACIAAAGEDPPPSAGMGMPDWLAAGGRGAGARRAWLRRLARHTARAEFDRILSARLPARWHSVFSEPGPLLPEGQTHISPLAAGVRAFSQLPALLPELAMLPGERTASDARTPAWTLHVQALGCALGGMALHGGVIPVGHARLSDAESLAASLRATAQAGLRVIHIVAEPAAACPTAGHRAGLRAMRNVFVFRPADASEALECAELALRRSHGPSVLLLSDSACAPLAERPTRTRCVHGGFVLREPSGARQVTLIASGAELTTTLAAADLLTEAGIATAVVSLPCWELFQNQEAAWRDQVLGQAPRVGIEAGSGFGWERWLGPEGVFIGSDSETGVCPITAERIAGTVKQGKGRLL